MVTSFTGRARRKTGTSCAVIATRARSMAGFATDTDLSPVGLEAVAGFQ